MNEAIFALCEETTFYSILEWISSLDIGKVEGGKKVCIPAETKGIDVGPLY